ncbi:hypothetical protein [Yoonia sp.]|uniref:hypothetical protein n=1 Tax=Yoonia sp. TaxID=2212373 RepID=UPI0023B464A8
MIRIFVVLAMLWPISLSAQDAEPPMTLERMARIVAALDPDAELTGAGFLLTIEDIPVLIVTDQAANRMRAMVPIRSAEVMSAQELQRVMQANFDSALDARYAIAQGRLWGVYLHPLAELQRDQLISGIAQTVNVAKSYGTLYSSGAGQFGGGDSGALQRELIEDLLERGQDI